MNALPPGWHYDEDTGAIMRDVIHRMGRRCYNCDYSGRAIYMITICLKERGRPVLAAWPEIFASPMSCSSPVSCSSPMSCSSPVSCSSPETAKSLQMPLTALGEKVLACWRRIPEYWPMVELLECQVMPDHFHGLLFVKKPLAVSGKAKDTAVARTFASPKTEKNKPKTLGDVIRGFKTGCREVGWQDGYVDTILYRRGQLKNMVRYIRDNPRRLWQKRARPELFRVLGDVEAAHGRFAAIGNKALLKAPHIFQVQVSRSFFAYQRDSRGAILKNAPPAVATSEFEAKRSGFLEAAEHGAVLLSPCISEGEREIARLAFDKGLKVITLSNKGFSPLYKPGGKLFDLTAKGNLLMLAPISWPYIPGEKKITRIDACVLNRIAQWISGSGAIEIKYRGIEPAYIDRLAAQAIQRHGDIPRVHAIVRE